MKAKVIDLEGNFTKELELPAVFEEEFRPDLIKRAVIAIQSNRFQPKGPNPLSGLRTSAESWGTGFGMARVPRIKGSSRAARVPQAVGGREAHPPKPEKKLWKKINKKERRKAIRVAIAATIKEDIVRSRGHRFAPSLELPIVVEDSFASLEKTAEVADFFKRIGVWEDILRAKKRKIRSGRGKMRGRRYKTRKSILIVLSGKEESANIRKAVRNFPGVDVFYVRNLNVEVLAPGAQPGRLTIWTESSIKELAEMGV
ncbi:MAG: 50S ribosomal protein L4 [Candidatus Methanospirareceae archaeon]